MSLLGVPYLIKTPPNGSANCHKMIVSLQNRNAVVIAGRFKYDVLLEITMTATTTGLLVMVGGGYCFCASGDCWHWLNNHVAVTQYKNPHDTQNLPEMNYVGTEPWLSTRFQ